MRLTAFAVPLMVVLAAAQSVAGPADATNPVSGYSHRGWTDFDDVHQPSAIYAITQDADGYIWVGFLDGLVRFDGARFVNWNALRRPVLPNRVVTALAGARDGGLWIGYGNLGGVSHYKDGVLTNYAPADILGRRRAGAIRIIVEGHDGSIWAAGYSGLARFQNNTWERIGTNDNLPDGTVHLLYEDANHCVWVGNPSGIFRLNAGSTKFERVGSGTSVTAAFSSNDDHSPWKDAVEEAFLRFDPTAPPPLVHDAHDQLWGVGRNGLLHVNAPVAGGMRTIEQLTAQHGLTSDHVTTLFEDRESNVWVGTEVGLDLLAMQKPGQIRGVPELARRRIMTLTATPDGAVWAGTNSGLYRGSPTGSRWYSTRDGLPGDSIHGFHRDGRGGLWILTDRGVANFLDGRFQAVALPSDISANHISAITTDAEGALWLCGPEMLARWKGGALTTYHDTIAGRRPNVMFTDSTGRVWIGFWDGGVAIFRNGQFDVHEPGHGLAAGRVTSIYEDAAHAVWIGTLGGLTRFAAERFTSLPDNSGISHLMVTSLVDDSTGQLWISSLSGLVRVHRDEFDKATKNPSYRVQYRRFGPADGLDNSFTSSGSPASTRTTDGLLWLAKRGGVAIIEPGKAGDAPLPPVRIEQILADDRAFSGRDVQLPANTSRVQVEYTSLTFSSIARTQFRYKLEGFDRDWVDAGTLRQAFYTNLPPRHYTFRVAATHDGSRWNEASDPLEFSVLPAFYQTSTFYVLSALALAVAVWGAWQWRLHAVRRQYSLVLAERARLGREIHDTLLQGMVGVALQIHGMSETLGSSTPGSLKERLDRARDRLEHYIRETRVSIWDLRSPTLETKDLPTALREAGETITAGSGVQFELDVHGKPVRCEPRVEEHLLRIAQEAIANAIRHAEPTRISVNLSYDNGTVGLRVHDNGHGFNPDEVTRKSGHSWGLTSMRERAQQIGARFRCASSQSSGTDIEAIAPLAAS